MSKIFLCALLVALAVYHTDAACTFAMGTASCTVTPAGQFINTCDNSFIAYGHGHTVQYNQNSFIGAGVNNSILSVGPTPQLGDAFIGAGDRNKIQSQPTSAIICGRDNQILPPEEDLNYNGANNIIGAGEMNKIVGGYGAFLGGGFQNTASGFFAVIGSGEANNIGSATANAIITGYQNTINPAASVSGYNTIANGYQNTIVGANSFIGSGQNNKILNGAQYAVLGGGNGNSISTGSSSVIPGGEGNTVSGTASFVAGTNASDNAKNGCFVWNDRAGTTATPTQCSVNNQVVMRAVGGYYFYTNLARSTGAALFSGAGTWSNLCDKDVKDNIQSQDYNDVLEKLLTVPITTWHYTASPEIKHLGPMAQDFHKAFGFGPSERYIDTVDMGGVAFASIHALNGKIEAKAQENKELKERVAALEAKLARFEDKLTRLEKVVEKALYKEL